MASDLPAAWGRRLRELRDERKVSVLELARRALISPQYVYLLEAGRHAPSEEVRDRIAAALGVEVGEIFKYPAREAS